MADFTSELQKLMSQWEEKFAPQGGFGIQGMGALQDMLRRDSAAGARGATRSDLHGLQQAGMGRSVAGAFSGGARRSQFSRSLMDALTQLSAKNSQLAGNQRQNLMSTLAPIAHQESMRPSFLSSLLGNVLGTGAQLFGPGLANKVVGNPLMDLFKQMQGQQGFGQMFGQEPSMNVARMFRGM